MGVGFGEGRVINEKLSDLLKQNKPGEDSISNASNRKKEGGGFLGREIQRSSGLYLPSYTLKQSHAIKMHSV